MSETVSPEAEAKTTPPAPGREPAGAGSQVGLGGVDPGPKAVRAPESAAEAVVHEFMDQYANPEHPLGPFSDPHSTMIAGIEEHVGYVPKWLLLLLITAVLLAMIMWIPTSY